MAKLANFADEPLRQNAAILRVPAVFERWFSAEKLAYFLLLPAPVPSVRPADVSGRAPERRFHHRVLVGASAWLVVNDERIAAECVDVSMGGAALRTDAGLSPGTVLRLELALGRDGRSASIRCEVVRSTSRELGLRFMALDRPSLEAIVSLL